MPGHYLYILTNPSIPGLIKVGKTTTSPERRMSELHSTGVPTPFSCAICFEVENCHEAERIAHQALSDCRVSENREFFDISVESAIRLIINKIGPYVIFSSQDDFGVKEIEDEIKRMEIERELVFKKWQEESFAKNYKIRAEKEAELEARRKAVAIKRSALLEELNFLEADAEKKRLSIVSLARGGYQDSLLSLAAEFPFSMFLLFFFVGGVFSDSPITAVPFAVVLVAGFISKSNDEKKLVESNKISSEYDLKHKEYEVALNKASNLKREIEKLAE